MLKNILKSKETAKQEPQPASDNNNAEQDSNSPDVSYHLDVLSPTLIAGWVCKKTENGFVSSSLKLRINDSDIRDYSSNLPRQDLAEAGYGDGLHGFEASTNWQKFEVGINRLELTLDDDVSVVHEFEITQRQLMVAMSDHICRHVDESILQMGRNILNEIEIKS